MRNIKIKRTTVVILMGIILVVVLAVVLIISFNKLDGNEQQADVNVSKINLKPSQVQDEYEVKEGTQVDILFENTAIPVGTSLKVTAIVSPDDNEKSLIWTSSNEQVFSVDKDGVITINGVGTATLTATVGSVSDAVVVEGITKVSQGSSNGFVVYTGNNNNGKDNTYDSSGNHGRQEDSGTGLDNGQQEDSGTGLDNGRKEDGGTGLDNGQQENSGTGLNHGQQENGQTGSTSSENSQTGGNSSDDIGSMLSGNGFEQTVSNVYVCRQDGIYYGEIVTQSNVTIIYIKQRSAAFDNRIQSVIENLLPGNSSYVWNSYVSASTDRTFTVDNRMVRIVVATGGGHSQIVIYN